jgi:hypothetical protein
MSTPTPLIDLETKGQEPDSQAAGGSISTGRLVLRLVLFVATIAALAFFLEPHYKRVLVWGLIDNDDVMRVLQVRDWLGGQNWFDVSQHRLNPPQGGDMHWSRLADLQLAALMAPLTAIFGADLGPKYAAFWAPLVLAVPYVWVVARTAKSLGGQEAFLPGIILAAGAPAALSYFLPGRVDHHGLQIILILGAIWGLFVSTRRSSALAGLAIAAGIAIGLEALPLQIVLIAWVAARWGFRGSEVKDQTLGFGLGFGVSIVVLFVATVPAAKWNMPVNDAIGRGYVVLGFCGGILLAGAAFFVSQAKMLVRFAVLAVIGLIVLSGIAIFPEIIVPPYGRVDPLLIKLWMNNVFETAPLYSSKLSRVLSFALFPALATVGAIIAVIMTKDKDRDIWILAAVVILVAGGLAIFWQSRTAGLATAVSGVITAGLVALAYKRLGWKVAVGFALVVNPIIPGLVGAGIAKVFEPKEARFVTGGGQSCYSEPSFKALADAKPGLVVAPVDMGARIIITTPHKALAAPYHRNNVGNLAAYQVFLMPQDKAQARVANLNVNYLAICKKSAEVMILSREAPRGLMADLEAGRIPAWLVPMPTPKGSDVLAFRVKAN